MVKIAITGGIGSGKSYVCRLLEEQGIKIFNCDNSAKRIIASSIKIRQQLTDVIGQDAYNGNVLNKAAVSAYILRNADNALRINNIVHPAVAGDFISSGLTWMECAILFSSGFNKLVDKVICVTAPLETRIERIVNRDNITREKAIDWIRCQMDQAEVAKLSDYEICNDGISDINGQIRTILKDIYADKHI